jgi:hypothetical protein
VETEINTSRSLGAIPILNAISCGVNIGITLSEGSLMEAFNNHPEMFMINAGATIYGCVTISWAPTGRAAAALNSAVGGLACVAGIAQAVVDENDDLEDPDNVIMRDLDVGSAVFGCAVTALGNLF